MLRNLNVLNMNWKRVLFRMALFGYGDRRISHIMIKTLFEFDVCFLVGNGLVFQFPYRDMSWATGWKTQRVFSSSFLWT